MPPHKKDDSKQTTKKSWIKKRQYFCLLLTKQLCTIQLQNYSDFYFSVDKHNQVLVTIAILSLAAQCLIDLVCKNDSKIIKRLKSIISHGLINS